MRKFFSLLWHVIIFGALLFLTAGRIVKADELKYSRRLSPNDYLLQNQDPRKDPVFDKFRTVDLGVNLGVGSDCGRIDFKSTLRSSLSNVLDSKYFGDMGKDILGASPMLLTCYFSPTWCAILKHSQINAHWLSQMRLDQCSIVDKYVDTRTQDFYQERQTCVRGAIEKNGGNLEQAMESCKGNSIYNADLSNWAGEKYGAKVGANRLIDSSAKWAGLSDPDSQSSLNLVKALVGDTVVSKGNVSVEYGSRTTPLTPRTYLQSLESTTYDKLCGKILKKISDTRGNVSIDRIVSDDELQDLSPSKDNPVIDKQTIRALSYMNPKQRDIACRKLSGAVAMTAFSTDVNRSLDVMTTLAQNPNLPAERKKELEEKRQALKEQIEMTVELQKSRNDPLNTVLNQINGEGSRLQSESVRDGLFNDADAANAHQQMNNFTDCSDGVFCAGPDGRN